MIIFIFVTTLFLFCFVKLSCFINCKLDGVVLNKISFTRAEAFYMATVLLVQLMEFIFFLGELLGYSSMMVHLANGLLNMILAWISPISIWA